MDGNRYLIILAYHSYVFIGELCLGIEMSALTRFLKDRNGATAIEYGLIAALVCVTIIGGLSAVGTSTTVTLGTITGYF